MFKMHPRFVFVLAAFAAPAAASGQNTILTGVVRSETQAAVRGAFVQIQSLNLTTLTNDQGFYSVSIPASAATGTVTVRFTSIGFKTVESQVALRAGRIVHNVTMAEQAISLDEVLVTGTAGRQERRAQAGSVASISAANVLANTPIQSVSNLVAARTPSVVFRQNSGSTGTGGTIRIRGQASITQSNEPLVFIDGIRVSGGDRQIFGVGNQSGTALNDIKVEDVESIEIVKGPAAATLYGADANAGVINIITKRGRQGAGFTQSVTVEYGEADPNFRPPDNYARCSAANITNTNFPACAGQQAGAVLVDNPLVRGKAFGPAESRNLAWSLRGGGEKFSAFASIGAFDENGTLASNALTQLSSTVNFDYFINEKVRLEFGFGLVRTTTQLPQNDNNIYGYLGGGLLGDPRTIGAAKDGWYGTNREVHAISSQENYDKTLRVRPRFSVNYQPAQWFTHRFTVGGDVTRTRAYDFWARNLEGWWDDAPRNTGRIGEARQSIDRITVDYLGNLTRSFGDALRGDFSFGSQIITRKLDTTDAQGTGLITNEVRTVNSASQLTSGGQTSSEDRQVGIFGQAQASFKDRLYLQLGGRVDQSSSFGAESKPFFSPKVGLAYLISSEPYFQNLVPENMINTLRLRAAFGATGRSPTSGARSNLNPSANQITATSVVVGVTPGATGNPKIKPERGQEIEVGFEAGLLQDRLGLDVLFFRKVTSDAILELPLAASLGINSPDVNVGKILNRGFEISANGRVLTRDNVALEVRAAVSTLHNEVLDLGGTPETATRKVGFPLNGTWQYRIRNVDVVNNITTVSDTLEFVGKNQNLPGYEGTLSATLTLFKNLTFYVQADGRGDRVIYNNTDQFRDRQNAGVAGALAVLGCAAYMPDHDPNCSDAAKEKYMRKFGCVTPDASHLNDPAWPPCQTDAAGQTIYWRTETWTDSLGNARGGRRLALVDVRGDYDEDGSFLKLREASASYRLPLSFVERYMRAQSATVTLAMRNINTWTKFTGLDPESDQFLTQPQDRRWIARMNLTF
jgi:TonB-dependent starch-binding outer membrane protein SusC